jgi:hypothetical protein
MDIPLPPEISEAELEKCRKTADFCPVLFEWYKYVGLLSNFYASIQRKSPAIKNIPKIHYSILIGLLNRCSRLMLSNVALSHKGLFGETTSIIDRSIFESSIKLGWLCHKGDEESFTRFIAEGLKTEIELKRTIEANINKRSGNKLTIEGRMLTSINNYFHKSELTEEQILASKKLPDLASMINVIGKDRIAYVVGQRIGSHHVHGTWVSLWYHYLEEHDDGVIHLRDHNCETHVNQYAYISIVVLDAIKAFVEYVCKDSDDIEGMTMLIVAVSEKIQDVYQEVVGTDFDVV